MSEEAVTIPLPKDWIAKLWKRWLAIRESRPERLRKVARDFGVGDLELLAKTYVEPDCQRTNPADHHEEEPLHALRQPVREYFNRFLEGEFFDKDGRQVLFILSDAGMGKTSLLLMLKLTHEMRFWPQALDFRLLKLGPDSLSEIGKIEKPDRTVLLLDALDEDTTAWGKIEERLEALLHATRSFRQVICTCRTQFFPEGGKAPIEKPEMVVVSGFSCNMVYLSPFNDGQVEAYLRKRFPNRGLARLRKWLLKRDNEDLEKARRVILPMRTLRMRPMLLAYVELLMDSEVEELREYWVYEALVDHWLRREVRKKTGGPSRQLLWEACGVAAMHLQRTGQRTLSRDELQRLLVLHADARHIEGIDVTGRSLLNLTSDRSYRFAHYSIQEFLAAHRLVTDDREQAGETLRATDQLLRFLFSWACEAPRERLPRIPWARLDCEGVKGLRGVDLSKADLHGLALPRFLRGVDLSGANLQGADLREVDLRDADLRDADLRGARIEGANFAGCQLVGARFEKNGIELVWVPGGELTLGTNDDLEGYRKEDLDWPKPAHRVRLSPFWISKHPVTNAQYQRFLEANPDQAEPALWKDERF